ncbi:MAG: TPM domain-containing protein [Treponema sp.]
MVLISKIITPPARITRLAAILTISVVTAVFPAFSLDIPALTNRVMDEADILSATEKSELSDYLESLDNTTGIQIAVLTIPSLENEDLQGYSVRVAQAWRLGEKGKDNGALLLVAMNEHKVRIEVGYGLEDKLTDAKCGLIIRNVITPEFRSGDYGKGIIKGVKNMGGIASGNAALVTKSVATGGNEPTDNDTLAALFFGLIFLFVWLMIIPGMTGRHHWWLPWLLFPLFGGSSRSWHDHHNDFTGFGGGGGGFSGGGGSFGGGGASGGW